MAAARAAEDLARLTYLLTSAGGADRSLLLFENWASAFHTKIHDERHGAQPRRRRPGEVLPHLRQRHRESVVQPLLDHPPRGLIQRLPPLRDAVLLSFRGSGLRRGFSWAS